MFGFEPADSCVVYSHRALALFQATAAGTVAECRRARAAALVKTFARAGIERDRYPMATKLVLARVFPAAGSCWIHTAVSVSFGWRPCSLAHPTTLCTGNSVV